MIIEFSTDGAAFDEHYGLNKEYEISFILRDIEKKVKNGFTSGTIVDINGNKIGYWKL